MPIAHKIILSIAGAVVLAAVVLMIFGLIDYGNFASHCNSIGGDVYRSLCISRTDNTILEVNR